MLPVSERWPYAVLSAVVIHFPSLPNRQPKSSLSSSPLFTKTRTSQLLANTFATNVRITGEGELIIALRQCTKQ
jgi:hypothetical protein